MLRRPWPCPWTLLAVLAGSQALAAPPAPAPPRPADPLAALAFRSLGPSAGGRATRVVGVPGDPRTYYLATAASGVWKSSDGGLRWEPVFDDQPVATIGSIAVAPSDPNVVYVGTGEANIRGNVIQGDGIYKSLDGGKTWNQVWKQAGQIGTLVVHPRRPEVAFAAVLGSPFGPNPERGVYRTTDGGRSWQQVLRKDADTGASDVALDPSNPHVVFAGLWQARRRPWELTSGGPGSGLYVSRDGGDTWKQLEAGQSGLPAGPWGKIGVAVAPSDGRRVYALIEAEQGGLYRSDDGGQSWSLANGHKALRQRAWYYSTLTVDPANREVVWFPQVPLLKTVDGGRSLTVVRGAHHGDYHDAWIDPADPRRVAVASDGGVDVSVNGGESWYAAPLPIAQFYHVSADSSVPYRVMGPMQDLGTVAGPSNSLAGRIRLSDWQPVGGGETGHAVAKPDEPEVVYAGEYGGYLSRWDGHTRQARNVSIYPENPSGHGAADLRLRFQWTAPVAVSPHDPRVVYHAGNVLFRSTDGGETWSAISGDLTRDDESKQRWSGGPITGDNTGVEVYGTIFAVAESPREKGLIWAGTDDGRVHLTRDGGATWSEVTANVPGLPEWATVSAIEPSPHEAAGAYLVAHAYRLGDPRPYAWKTSDYGRTWKSVSAGLAGDVSLRVLREDPGRRGHLFLGSERGLLRSTDDGATWQPLKLGLPTVQVADIVVKDDDLVLATMGRSLWVLDDITPLRELAPQVTAAPAHLFAPRPATRWRYSWAPREAGSHANRPAGAILYYWLKEKAKSDLTLEIRDAQGRLVRALTSRPEEREWPADDPDSESDEAPKPELVNEPGVQRVVWDLAWQAPERIRGARIDSGDARSGLPALPGDYTVTLTVDGRALTAPLAILPDPRVKLPASALEQQLALSLELREAISRVSRAVVRVRSIRSQLQARVELARGQERLAGLVKSAEALAARCDGLEQRLHNPKAQVTYDILAQKGGTQLYSRLVFLYENLNDSDGPPTQGLREVFAEQRRELEALHSELEGGLLKELEALDREARALDLPLVADPGPKS